MLSLASTPLAIKASPNIDDSMHEIACNAKVWLYAIGCSVILSALEAKLVPFNLFSEFIDANLNDGHLSHQI